MMARWLRFALAAQAGIMVLVFLMLTGAGVATPAAATAALSAAVILHSLPLIAAYALSRWRAYAPPRPLTVGRHRAWSAAGMEWLAYLALFVIIQPFESWWMGSDRVRRPVPGQCPVLLIHGYLCNRGLWWWLRRALRADGAAVATLNLEPPLGDIEASAAQLHDRIEQLLAETGAAQVMLVAHSMGGLVARAYLQHRGRERVAGLITLATPHFGTRLARLGPGRNAREMERGSPWLQALARPGPLPTTNVWSARDEIIIPQDNARLPAVEERICPAMGHLAMVFSPAVLAVVRSKLTSIRNGSRAATG
jgi:triacylglycerol lipase